MHLSYSDALEQQNRRTLNGEKGWLLFCCPPTITLGRRAHFSEVLVPMSELIRKEVQLLSVDRGGRVAYHGPGQILGFPLGQVEDYVGDPRAVRAFICRLQTALKNFVQKELHSSGQTERRVEGAGSKDAAGVWLHEKVQENESSFFVKRKIGFIGLHFKSKGISHGFALNIFPDPTTQEIFDWIIPCGEVGAKPSFLFKTPGSMTEIEQLCFRLDQELSAEFLRADFQQSASGVGRSCEPK